MALTKITNSLVAVNAIQGTLIADNAVTAVHIVNNAITATQLADNAVTATKIQNGIIATDHLAADLITAAKIADDAISEEHLDVTVISSLSTVTANSSDYVMIGDTSDSNNLKKALVSDLGNDLDAAVTINESGAAVDFRVEGDTEQNLFFVDGSADKIGIGTNAPEAALDIATAGSTAKPLAIRITNAAATGYAWELWRDNTDGDLRFGEELNDSDTTRVTFESGGNVGIGITTPNESGFGATSNVLSIAGTAQDAFGVLELISTDVTSSNRIGEIRFGNLDAGSSFASNAGIRATRDGADNSSALSLWTTNAGTFAEVMRIRSSGGVGIGTAGYDGQILAVNSGTGNTVFYGESTDADCYASFRDNSSTVNVMIGATGNDLCVQFDGTEKVKVAGATGTITATGGALSSPTYSFQGDTDTGISRPTGDAVNIVCGGTERARVTANGVTFNGDTAAANALDDYEEGTWTPLLKNNSNNSAATMSMQVGWYTKVGNLVTVGGSLVWSSNGSNANGGYTVISGLPFAAHDTANTRNGGCLGAVNGFTVADDESLSLVVDPSASFAYVVRQDSGTYHHNNTIAASGAIYGFLITYHV